MENMINRLPDDCLEHIFSFLPIKERLEVEKVCKRWRNIGERGWPDIISMTLYHKSDNMIYSILRRCGRFLRELDIPLSSEHPHCLSMVLQLCRLEQLERIEIDFRPDSTERQKELEIRNLKKLLGKSKNLVDITIIGDLGMYGIDYLNLVNPTTLRELMIMNHDELISFNPDRFSNLKELTAEGIEIYDDEMRSDDESLEGLEIISIEDCYISGGFIQRIQSFTNLEDLFLKNNICDIKNEDIYEIASHCEKIREMTLIGMSTLTSECFQHLGKMPSLEVLYRKNFHNVNSHDMVHLTNVRELFFDSCPDIPMDDGLIQLITKSSNLEELRLSHIRDLDISFINDVQLIFHRGLRQKHLHFTAYLDYSDELLGRTFPIVIDEPLLTLRANLFGGHY